MDIFIHLEDIGATYKATIDALNNHFELKKNCVFERGVFCLAIQGPKDPSIIFVSKLASIADQNTDSKFDISS